MIKKFRQIIFLHNYLESLSIKHFFFEALPDYINHPERNIDYFLEDKYTFYLDRMRVYLGDENKLRDVYLQNPSCWEFCQKNGYELTPLGNHPKLEGHRAWANFVYKFILQRLAERDAAIS
jgi:hypothetical protein